MTIVRLVADDLTGALDGAAPLARLAGPLPVVWHPDAISEQRGSFALDTESRDSTTAEPRWLAAFDGADLAYKKIDSLLRGNTVNEIATCLASGRFPSAVMAPAFPAQQRITRDGRQYWRADRDEPWQAVRTDLGAGLRARGIQLRHAAAASDLTGTGHFLCDAATEGDLAALVAAAGRLAGPVLWCGSGGLARALAGTPIEAPPPRLTAPLLEAPLLLVIGSHHPVTLGQARALADGAPETSMRVRLTDAEISPSVIDALARRLAEGGPAALLLEVPSGTGARVAGPFFDRVLALAAERLAPPRTLLVTGGATLRRLMGVLGARALRVDGELLAGVPRSVVQGGRWDGIAVVSKSGAFGDPGLLIRLALSAKGGVHE